VLDLIRCPTCCGDAALPELSIVGDERSGPLDVGEGILTRSDCG